jgi:hypothetical protein
VAHAHAQVRLVEVVGCLTEERPVGADASGGKAAGAWLLTRGSNAERTETPSTSAAAIRDAASRRLGNREYRLLGVAIFDPSSRVGHKVVVKGLLIRDGDDMRLNVTSLQTASEDCSR